MRNGAAILLVTLAGCAPVQDGPPAAADAAASYAAAVLHPTTGSSVWGTVTFAATDSGVLIRADVSGLAPGAHGFHVHEWGDCSAPDATSAGGHFNPEASPHGAPDGAERHVGDLGNLVADASGTARYERTDRRIALGGANSIIGRAVMVHAAEDDLASQPTGSAGARLACGVIGIVRGAE